MAKGWLFLGILSGFYVLFFSSGPFDISCYFGTSCIEVSIPSCLSLCISLNMFPLGQIPSAEALGLFSCSHLTSLGLLSHASDLTNHILCGVSLDSRLLTQNLVHFALASALAAMTSNSAANLMSIFCVHISPSRQCCNSSLFVVGYN